MLTTCPSCACHVRAGSTTCPHCGATLGSIRGRTAAAVILGLTLVGCPDPNKDVQALYGVVDTSRVDEDGDGWQLPEDCDDENADIHPEATETAGDGVDSNCDGEDDT